MAAVDDPHLGADASARVVAEVGFGGDNRVTPAHLARFSASAPGLELLTETINTDLPFERLCTAVRRALVTAYQPAAGFPAAHRALVVALAHQCRNNEFVFSVAPEEALAVDAHMPALTRAEGPALEDLVLLWSLYRPVEEFPEQEALARVLAAPSATASGLFERVNREAREDRIWRHAVPTFGTVGDHISVRVGAQYEESPYPRWLKLGPRWQAADDALKALVPSESVWSRAAGSDRILVAGCGTGRHALQVAIANPAAHVVAVDLSRAALARGMGKAAEHDITNVTFIQGDILDLPALGQSFGYIECVGVLHHIADHRRAWANLTRVLLPGGTMYIGVYNVAARLLIRHLRDRIPRAEQGSQRDAARAIRQRLLDDPDLARATDRLAKVEGFYTLSMFRDLICHTYEHHYTVDEIESLTRSLGLRLIAAKPPVRNAPPLRSFDAWRAMQLSYGGSLRMFLFWLRKPGGVE